MATGIWTSGHNESAGWRKASTSSIFLQSARRTMNRQDKAWLASASIIFIVGIVGIAAYVNQNNQERRAAEAQSEAMQDLATLQDRANQQDVASRMEMDRRLSESALQNELDSASRRESALQAQIAAMDATQRQQAERELQDLRAQRVQLQKQLDCERIQLSMNQLTAKGESDQALSLQKQWNQPCPNLQVDG